MAIPTMHHEYMTFPLPDPQTGESSNNPKRPNSASYDLSTVAQAVFATAVVASAAFITLRYRVAAPTEYIVRTGLGIKTIAISKTALQWPFQTASRLSMQPVTLSIDFDGKSEERVPFKLPTNWTVGPKDNPESLVKYALRLLSMNEKEKDLMIRGTIQGDARMIVAGIPLDKLFSDRESLKGNLVGKVNEALSPMGLMVYNANIAELDDLDGDNKFFAEQKRRALSAQQKEGEVSERTNLGETRQKLAEIETQAQLVENDRKAAQARSAKDLAVTQADLNKQTEIAKEEAKAAAETRRYELQKAVEECKRSQETEKLRAVGLSSANVDAEIAVRKAQGQADAVKIEADANRYQREQAAQADLVEKQRQADGILAIKNAEAKGLETLIQAAGSIDGLNKYLLIRDDVLPKLAEKQADALKGLAPKVNVWSSGVGAPNNLSTTVTDLFKTAMPLFDGIKAQTGYDFLSSVPKEIEQDKPQSGAGR